MQLYLEDLWWSFLLLAVGSYLIGSISFARIILKNPSVIILDEATSSIDTETENMIQKALDVILSEKTAFIVAHRLSTIRNADRILYIADKGIAEEGNHEELMEKKGLYYRLNVR